MQTRHIDDLVDAYALGALEPDEVDAVERHLETCEPCRALTRQAYRTAERFFYTVPQVAPPPSLRERVLRRVREEAAAQHQPPHGGAPVAVAQHDDEPVPIAGQVHRGVFHNLLRSLLGDEPEPEHEAGDLLRDLLADPRVVIRSVAGTGDAPGASARLINVPERRDAVLLASGLRRPAPGTAYQVWLLAGGTPEPNTLFTVNRFGRGAAIVHARELWQGFDTVAVTPEPETGSRGPTGSIVLAGALTH